MTATRTDQVMAQNPILWHQFTVFSWVYICVRVSRFQLTIGPFLVADQDLTGRGC